MAPKLLIPLHERAGFDALIDARSPSEFALDHLPGAINCPVLDDAERARVGTLYVQQSAFEARKVGAALVARRIAGWVEALWSQQGKDWRPLVYCWRGGMRSGSAVTVMRMVGWDAGQLQGGYKAWRAHAIRVLAEQVPRLRLQVLSGPTGSGKTRLLGALAEQGAQVIDLEGLAGHRGSVLGGLPDQAQPSQKAFETRLADAVEHLDPARPVFVEAESRRIGRIALPDAVVDTLRAAPVTELRVERSRRRELLLEDYAWLIADAPQLQARLAQLQGLLPNALLARWQQLAAEGPAAELAEELLALHYDPLYAQSQQRHLRGLAAAAELTVDPCSPQGLAEAAAELRRRCGD